MSSKRESVLTTHSAYTGKAHQGHHGVWANPIFLPLEHCALETVTANVCVAVDCIASRCVELAGPWIPDFIRSGLWSKSLVSGIAQCSLAFVKNLTTSSLRYERKKDLIISSTGILQCLKDIPAYMKQWFLQRYCLPQTLWFSSLRSQKDIDT